MRNKSSLWQNYILLIKLSAKIRPASLGDSREPAIEYNFQEAKEPDLGINNLAEQNPPHAICHFKPE
jgi:hypothetical protein